MNAKVRVLTIGILCLLVCNFSFVSDNVSFGSLALFSCQTTREEELAVITVPGEAEPMPLPGTVYDYYANGEIVNRGSSTNPLPRPASMSSHPITKDEFQMINLEEFVVLPFNSGVNPRLYQDAGEGFAGNYSFPENIQIFSSDPSHGYTADIALGDVDGDGYDEVIIADNSGGGWGSIIIYDDEYHNYTKIGDFVVKNPTGTHKSITTGDVDGDGIDEIVYTRWIQGASQGSGRIGCSMALWVYEFVPTWKCLTPYYFTVKSGYYESGFDFDGEYDKRFTNEPEVACGDFDGDGRDEIACALSFRNWDPAYEDFWILDDYNNSFTKIWSYNIFTETTGDVDLACGDFDGDRLDEIAYAACPWTGDRLEMQLAIIDNDFSVELLPKLYDSQR